MRTIEDARQEVQRHIDDSKAQDERNRLGQFGTETTLAREMLTYANGLVPFDRTVRFLDPAFGTGAFYSALLDAFPRSHIEHARGYEIDPSYGGAAKELWDDTSLDLRIEDFTRATPPHSETSRYNLVICNPPYVRHHHIESQDKVRLQHLANYSAGVQLSGLSGLYCYFLCISHIWMSQGGIAGWLIPSEFMDVNYGTEVKRYLLDQVTLLRIHRFDPQDVQFKDAYVSSAVVWFKKTRPLGIQRVEFTYGGTLESPAVTQIVSTEQLRATRKWTTYPSIRPNLTRAKKSLSDFFWVKRGLATGSNGFFIMSGQEARKRGLPSAFLRPILPPPRMLKTDMVESGEGDATSKTDQFVLIDCSLPEHAVQAKYPKLWEYFQSGKKAGIHEGYLCQHRDPWYAQEKRPPAPLLCSYMGRQDRKGRPFRFVLNFSSATATNVWLMLYPKPEVESRLKDSPSLLPRVWEALRDIQTTDLLGHGRVYGGGLYKLEPSELGNLPADSIASLVES